MADRLVTVESLPDGYLLLRGAGLMYSLARFPWARTHPAGVQLPAEGRTVALAALTDAGYRVVDRADGRATDTQRDNRPPPARPECAACGQQYRDAGALVRHARCVTCDEPLALRQAYEYRCPGSPGCDAMPDRAHRPTTHLAFRQVTPV